MPEKRVKASVLNAGTGRILNSPSPGMDSRCRVHRDADVCVKCNLAGKFRCGTCKAVYCSVACQKEDWAHHKFICLPFNKGTGLLKTPDKSSQRATPLGSPKYESATENVTSGKTGDSATSKDAREHERITPKQYHSGRKNNESSSDEKPVSGNRRQPKNELSAGQSHIAPKRTPKNVKEHPSSLVCKSSQTNYEDTSKETGGELDGREPNVSTVHPGKNIKVLPEANKKTASEVAKGVVLKKDEKALPKITEEAVQKKDEWAVPEVTEEASQKKYERAVPKVIEVVAQKKDEKAVPKVIEDTAQKKNERIVPKAAEEVAQKKYEGVGAKVTDQVAERIDERAVPKVTEEAVQKKGDRALLKVDERASLMPPQVVPVKDSDKVTYENKKSLLKEDKLLAEPVTAQTCKPLKLDRIAFTGDGPFKVMVSHVDTPHSFYMQSLVRKDLNAIMCKLQSVDEINPPESVSINQLVAAKFSDTMWYRALVEKVNGENLIVNYIDYGNTESVTLQNVRPLSQELSVLPVQCVWCRLANIEPLHGKWNKDAIEAFTACVLEVPLFATFTSNRCCGLQCVTLSDREINGGDRGDLMVFTNLATHSLPIHYNAMGMWKEECELTLYLPFIERLGVIFAMDKASVSEEAVTDILSTLGLECDSLKSSNTESITIGTLVAAKSPSDHGWYRAVVTDVTTTGWKVRYLDFGNSEEVLIAYLLPEKLCAIRSLSVCFDVDERYALECLPERFTDDDILIVTVKEVKGDIAYVDLKIAGEDLVLPAVACSVWKISFEEGPCADDTTEIANSYDTSSVPTVSLSTEIHEAGSSSFPAAPPLQPSPPQTCSLEQSPASTSVPACLLPQTSIPLGEVDIYPICVEAVDKIYVQALNTETVDKLQSLQNELNKKAIEEPFVKFDDVPFVGQIVCAKFTDLNWYRCLVETVQSPNEITIRYIDYGNVEVSTLENIRHLPERYYEISPLCIIAAPSGVHPNCTVMQLKTLLASGNDPLWKMNVVDNSRSPVKAILSLDGKKIDELLNEAFSSVEGPTDAALDNPDIETIKETVGVQSSSATIESVPEVTETTSLPSVTFGNMAVVEVPVGGTVDVIVTEVKSPEMIFCCVYDAAEIEKYDVMAVEMTTYANETGVSIAYDPQENAVCLAKSFADDVFYRGMVLTKRSNEMDIFFVDYGSIEVVPNEGVRPIPQQFLKLPLQAFQCVLHGLKSTIGYTEERCEEFKGIVKVNNMYNLEVMSKDPDESYYYIRIPGLESDLRAKGFLALQ